MAHAQQSPATPPIAAQANPAPPESVGDVDPRLLRDYWSGVYHPNVFAAVSPFTLTQAQQDRFGGWFGVDLSHYNFESRSGPCSADWNVFEQSGVHYVYSKASDGGSPDASFASVWSSLEARHRAKTLFRGAYHFLEPGVDAQTQAKAFLKAEGAENGAKPSQLPPMLDMEWSPARIYPGTAAYDQCPAARRSQPVAGKYYCDMWYTMTAADIVTLAKNWIELVHQATGKPVIIYTNVAAWWDPFIGQAGQALANSQAQWPSIYPGGGPAYEASWTAKGGSPKWKMPPLPMGAHYSTVAYDSPDLWQFSGGAFVSGKPFVCNGVATSSDMDMDWAPVAGAAFEQLFGPNSP